MPIQRRALTSRSAWSPCRRPAACHHFRYYDLFLDRRLIPSLKASGWDTC